MTALSRSPSRRPQGFFGAGGGVTPAGRPRVESVSPVAPRFPVRSGPPVVLSGMSRVSAVSSLVAGAAAPESGDFEYSVLPPFASHAATATSTAATAQRQRPPLRPVSMSL